MLRAHRRALSHSLVLLAGVGSSGPTVAAEPMRAFTEAEEVVAACGSPENGAGPVWCYGAPLLVRQGGQIFASVMEVGPGVPPLCNTRWRLYRRGAEGWDLAAHAAGFREREPCPLVA